MEKQVMKLKTLWDKSTQHYLIQNMEWSSKGLSSQQFLGMMASDAIFIELLKEASKKDRKLRILEAGCGSGKYSVALSLLGHIITCVDFAKTAVSAVKILTKSLETYVYTFQADILKLPFKSNTFDLIFQEGVIEHMEETAKKKALREIARVTKKGGLIIIFVPNKLNPLYYFWKYTRYPGLQEVKEKPISFIELRHQIEAAGLTFLRDGGINIFLSLVWWPEQLRKTWKIMSTIEKNLNRKIPSIVQNIMGREIYAIARK